MRFDSKGWAKDGVTKTPTKSFYKKPNQQHIIVMHYTAGYNAKSAVNTFLGQKKPRSSAHFVVDVNGEVIQMVSTLDVAFHAGGSLYRGRPYVNNFSIGIEIVNPGYHFKDGNGGYLNWARKPVSAKLLAPFPGFTEAFDPWVGSTAFWPHYPEAQLDAVEKLTSSLLGQYDSITDIVGHKDVDTARRIKVDPGPAFPMLRFRKLLSQREDDTATKLQAEVTDAEYLNVRGGAGTNFDKLSWGPLRRGEFVEVLMSVGNWDYVQRWIEGKPYTGWVYSAYLTPK